MFTARVLNSKKGRVWRSGGYGEWRAESWEERHMNGQGVLVRSG